VALKDGSASEHWTHLMKPDSYLAASTAIGIAQVADAIMQIKYPARWRAVRGLFSLAEYGWAIVSYLVWRDATKTFPDWLPESFMAYVAAGFLMGVVLASRHRGPRAELQVPKGVFVVGGVFGAYFAVASALQIV
jgi:hypothetical protein